ncbi:MAG: hypothetical protein IJA94_06685 [Bacilli bacterium]|nr:hypothetical protein [Bacilli bacterium]MBQ3415286.1 hypothetical protein [Clostridia bacterium]MBQ4584557.1 hypothetical protein [Bacilli bacterium]MBR0058190.1 hypothetical protein [Methanobrevibacter sp.]MBR0371562.1 hypothetical protein [Methanobrevibacter sp.]
METSLMVYDYPEPPEEPTKEISGTIYVKYTFKDVEVPKNWDLEDIIDDIKMNLSDYTSDAEEEIEDIDV